MYDQHTILISKVSNGWTVTLPQMNNFISNEDLFRSQAKIMKEELTGDDFLKSLKSDKEETMGSVIENKNVFIFDDTNKMLVFLASTLKK